VPLADDVLERIAHRVADHARKPGQDRSAVP
jgi:hypothetical protein